MKVSSFACVASLLAANGVNSFVLPARPSQRRCGNKVASICALMPDLTFSPPDVPAAGIQEVACVEAAALMKRVAVPVSDDISSSGSVGISYVHWPSEKGSTGSLPLILVHGFDSSALEFRRLGPRLAARGIDTYAVDILGWGFTQLDDVNSFSADSKIAALGSFIESVLGRDTKFCIAGASLGGGAAIELAAEKQSTCQGLILIDAQGFVDGIGPMALMPTPVAKLGVEVLRSVPLRNSANQMSYFDKETFATEEAQVIGRIHCLREGWSDAMVSFMKSGGFSPSAKVPTINAPALVLWGRQDGILDGQEFANKFVETLPDARLVWVESCGHVPHLEQPDTTAHAIATFLASDVKKKKEVGQIPKYVVGAGVAGAGVAGALAVSQILDAFPSN